MNKQVLFMWTFFVLLMSYLLIYLLNWYFNKSVSYNNLFDKKTLIVYYSHSNHTEEVAKIIQQSLNCDIKKINSEEYENKKIVELTRLINQQIKNKSLPITNKIDISGYDIIFVGSPVWKGNISLPVKSFLINSNFDKKTIVPFYTFDGFVNKSKLDNQIKEFSDNANVLPSFLTVCYKLAFINFRLIKWLNRINFD